MSKLLDSIWSQDWDVPPDYITNPWGWPCQLGLGDEAASHPVDSTYPMIWIHCAELPRVVWDERLQLEYSA